MILFLSSLIKSGFTIKCVVQELWQVRTLKNGLNQIVAEILERLSREGVLDRDDAWECLANARRLGDLLTRKLQWPSAWQQHC